MSEKRKLTAKKYLEQLEVIDTMINQDLERLDDMKTDARCTGGIDYSKDRIQTSPQNVLEKRICNYVDYEKKLDVRIDQFVDVKEQIISEIRGLHVVNYINVLYKIYVQFKSIRQVSKEIKKSYAYTLELHKKALAAFEETYKNLYYLI